MRKNWLLGLWFVVAAIYILLSALDYDVPIIDFKVVLALLTVTMTLMLLKKRRFTLAVISLILIAFIFKDDLGLISMRTWWLIAASGLCLAIGLSIIFNKRPAYFYTNGYGRKNKYGYKDDSEEEMNGTIIFCQSSLSSVTKYLVSDNLKEVNIKCNLGEISVYFDRAILSDTGTQVVVNANLAEVTLYIPNNYNVVDKTGTVLGEVNHINVKDSVDFTKCIEINGHITLSELKIIRI